MNPHARTLDRLRLGERGRVARVSGEGTVAQRVMALGLLPGSQISIVAVAPMGDPITIAGPMGRISLRRAEAAAIEIE